MNKPISICCNAEVKHGARGFPHSKGIKTPFMCLSCGRGCFLKPIDDPKESPAWEKEFDEKFPLEYFASTEFPYSYKETPMEWQLLKWQEQETKKAKSRKQYFISFTARVDQEAYERGRKEGEGKALREIYEIVDIVGELGSTGIENCRKALESYARLRGIKLNEK